MAKPTYASPNIENAGPNRVTLLKDKDEPSCANPSTDNVAPNHDEPLDDIDGPN
jgi:hypothetical protein